VNNLKIISQIKEDWFRRPWWMNLMFYFCVYMTIIYMPFDFFYKPVELDEEVWFGITLHGWYAKLTEPLHWIIYGLGAYGFWKMKSWMWPWASVYLLQVVIAMFFWNQLDPRGGGLVPGLISAAIFCLPLIAMVMAREKFSN
tara:strand:+ start:132 stop:557 length:426 start_codon:yes stop_codon:yes gene_type:complete